MNASLFLPMPDAIRRELAAEIARSLRIVRDPDHPLAPVHKSMLNHVLLWRWTADAIHPRTGRVSPDAFKHNCFGLHHSAGARSHWESAGRPRVLTGRIVVHEHVMPKKKLIGRLKEIATDEDAVFQQLCQYCVGAVITNEEHVALKDAGLASDMPPGWDGQDAWARYHAAGITVLPPLGHDASLEVSRRAPTAPRRAHTGNMQSALAAEFRRAGCSVLEGRSYWKVVFPGAGDHDVILEHSGNVAVTGPIGEHLPSCRPFSNGGRFHSRIKRADLMTWGSAEVIASRIATARTRSS